MMLSYLLIVNVKYGAQSSVLGVGNKCFDLLDDWEHFRSL